MSSDRLSAANLKQHHPPESRSDQRDRLGVDPPCEEQLCDLCQKPAGGNGRLMCRECVIGEEGERAVSARKLEETEAVAAEHFERADVAEAARSRVKVVLETARMTQEALEGEAEMLRITKQAAEADRDAARAELAAEKAGRLEALDVGRGLVAQHREAERVARGKVERLELALHAYRDAVIWLISTDAYQEGGARHQDWLVWCDTLNRRDDAVHGGSGEGGSNG